MDIILDLSKSLEENAAEYFDKAKKAKKKLEGAKKAIVETKNKKIKIKKTIDRKISTKKEWYQKFHWSLSSKGKLIIGGRDATTNELVIKKHAENNDLVFHTDMKGSPFIVLKDGQNASIKEMEEAATLCLVHSQAWKKNMLLEVFYVKPEQLSKQGRAGEAAPGKGGFVIIGETKYLHPKLEFAVGVYEDKLLGGSFSNVKFNCKNYFEVFPGNNKSSEIAKSIGKKLSFDDLDEIIRVLPAGGCKLGKFV